MLHHSLRSIATTAALALSALLPQAAQASLIGDTVTCTPFSSTPPPLICSPGATVVGAGNEFVLAESGGPNLMNINFQASSIVLTSLLDISFFTNDSLTLGSLDDAANPFAVLAAVSLSNLSGVSNLTLGDLSFTDHSLVLNLTGVRFADVGSTATINLVFRTVNQLPEPAGLALVAVALAGLGAARRRRS